MASTARGTTGRDSVLWRLLTGTGGQLLALAVVFGGFVLGDYLVNGGTQFASPGSLRTIAVQAATVTVAALGMTIIIIAGGIDLSAGTCMALCATTLAWSMRADIAFLATEGTSFYAASIALERAQNDKAAGKLPPDVAQDRIAQRRARLQKVVETKLADAERRLQLAHGADRSDHSDRSEAVDLLRQKLKNLSDPQAAVGVNLSNWHQGVPNHWLTPWLSILVGICTGVAAGAVNGWLVQTLKVPPFIVTLGTMMLFLGLAKCLSDQTPIRPQDKWQIPPWFSGFVGLRDEVLWLGLPLGVWVALGLALLLAAVLRYSLFGRRVFALGSNEATARLCGIHVARLKIAAYAAGGLFFGLAGMYHCSKLSQGNPTSGNGHELYFIAAVVIGGGSLSGGRGSVLGTVAGSLIMAVVNSGCTQLGMENWVQDIVSGIIIIAAVTLDQLRQRRLAAG